MLWALLVFLIGCLVLAVVIYVLNLVLDMLTLPPQVKQIALIIIGLIGLVIVLILAVNVFRGGGAVLTL
jgi:Na+/phosphate symporter